MKRNTAALAALQAKLAAIENARDLGRAYYKQAPDDMLIAVSRHASTRFTENEHVIAFLQGFSAARIAHDEFKRGE